MTAPTGRADRHPCGALSLGRWASHRVRTGADFGRPAFIASARQRFPGDRSRALATHGYPAATPARRASHRENSATSVAGSSADVAHDHRRGSVVGRRAGVVNSAPFRRWSARDAGSPWGARSRRCWVNYWLTSSGWNVAAIRRIPSRQSTVVVPIKSCILVTSNGFPRNV